MKKETITFEILCNNPDRKQLKKLLTDQTGVNIIRFEEVRDTSFAKFKITCEGVYNCYQLGLLWGRAQILAKTNIE